MGDFAAFMEKVDGRACLKPGFPLGNIMLPLPHELSFAGLYFSPILLASILGILAAMATAHVLDRFRLSRYFANPPAVLLAIGVIYTIVIGTLFVGI